MLGLTSFVSFASFGDSIFCVPRIFRASAKVSNFWVSGFSIHFLFLASSIFGISRIFNTSPEVSDLKSLLSLGDSTCCVSRTCVASAVTFVLSSIFSFALCSFLNLIGRSFDLHTTSFDLSEDSTSFGSTGTGLTLIFVLDVPRRNKCQLKNFNERQMYDGWMLFEDTIANRSPATDRNHGRDFACSGCMGTRFIVSRRPRDNRVYHKSKSFQHDTGPRRGHDTSKWVLFSSSFFFLPREKRRPLFAVFHWTIFSTACSSAVGSPRATIIKGCQEDLDSTLSSDLSDIVTESSSRSVFR